MKRIFTVLIAILLVSAMLMSFASCGSDDTSDETEVFTTDEAVYTESATPVGKTSEEVLDYFNSIVNGVKTGKPAISYRFEKSVPDDSLKITKKGHELDEETDSSLKAINDSAAGIKDMILEKIKKTTGDVAYGADNTEVLFVKGESFTSSLTVADIDYATIKEVGDYYYITIAFNDIESSEDPQVLAKAFDLRDKDAVLASEEFAKTSAYLKFNDYSVAYTDCKITATVNRLTNEVENINYYKAALVTADMTGAGTFESYGDISVMFKLEDKADYTITWTNELPTSPLETTSSVSE